MTPLDIISLQQAKDFLVVDYPDKDAEITRHIYSAISFVENYTNIMMYDRVKSYMITGCYTEIFDAPISFDLGFPNRLQYQSLSVLVYGRNNQSINANVGYDNKDDIPSELIEACYKIILYLFENKDIYTADLPWDIQMLLNKRRRCII